MGVLLGIVNVKGGKALGRCATAIVCISALVFLFKGGTSILADDVYVYNTAHLESIWRDRRVNEL